MMRLYYTHNYKNEFGESHRLLAKAVAGYISDTTVTESLTYICLDDLHTDSSVAAQAAELVSSMCTTGDNGKPCIPHFAPFSISHSNNTWTMLIMSREMSCGLDVQYHRKADPSAIAKRFFAPEYAEHICSLAGGEADENEFFRMWTRREAFIKAIGGSVADSGIPSVLNETILYEGTLFRLEDIVIPEAPDLHAAFCSCSVWQELE